MHMSRINYWMNTTNEPASMVYISLI